MPRGDNMMQPVVKLTIVNVERSKIIYFMVCKMSHYYSCVPLTPLLHTYACVRWALATRFLRLSNVFDLIDFMYSQLR